MNKKYWFISFVISPQIYDRLFDPGMILELLLFF